MQELTFLGLSDDGSRLLLSLADGRRFALPVDERLRAATRGSGTRQGHIPVQIETLRPRDVQARLRAGATAAEVAEQAGWSLDRVESFAVPVMQERGFIALQAQRSMIRHRNGELALADVVAARLAERGVEIDDLHWDAWRQEDGRWTVLLAYPAGRNDQVATWVFDTDSRTLQPVDDEARWLSEYRADLQHDAAPAVAPLEPDEPSARIVTLPPSKARSPGMQASRHPALRRHSEQTGVSSEREPSPDISVEIDPPRPPKRATVPSWDEILFGGPGEPDGR